MRRVRSASRRVRKTGAVPVLGLTRAKSSGVRVKARSESLMASVPGRKKPQRVSGKVRSGPPTMRAQNLNEAWMSLKKTSEIEEWPVVETDWKKLGGGAVFVEVRG